MTASSASSNVRVSVRIRPILGKEKIEGCMECVRPTSKTELLMEGKEKRFTFDSVFGKGSSQNEIYETNVSPLVKSLFDGYNATVLAYGQTGSGKTYTMGTATDLTDGDEASIGMIPRAMEEIFEIIEEKKESNPGAEFYLRVQFLEVYGEDIRDLLDPAGAAEGKSVNIREGKQGEGVTVDGAREESVKSTQEMLGALDRGALCRTTGSTQMNFHSSRSHAIFTVIIEQHLPTASNDETNASSNEGGTEIALPEEAKTSNDNNNSQDKTGSSDGQNQSNGEEEGIEYRTAKFHFVDLAGSERAKRTGATGTRLKEGININKGLLALGNVISALGDENRQVSHVPYRDSKLTRMLQDSLGGNSRTLMIACVSPADANIEETLNALRYANRARNIKNKPVVNRDPTSSQIAFLKAQIAQLKAALGNGGTPNLDAFSFDQNSPLSPSPYGNGGGGNVMGAGFREELDIARAQAKEAEDEVKRLQEVVQREKRQRSELQEQYVMAKAQVDFYLQQEEESGNPGMDPEERKAKIDANAKYIRRIEELQRQLEESDEELTRARRHLGEMRNEICFDESLDELEREIVRNARIRKSLGMPMDELNSSGELQNESAAGAAAAPTTTTASTVSTDGLIEPDAVPGLNDEDEIQVTEEDDEVTKELKRKYTEQQDSLRKVVNSYDVTLRSKQAIMKQIVEERKKFEAMKVHYETKMARMNAEVKDTQKQRDELDEKIRELEGKKSSDATRTQITKLRIQLKQKTERLKNLEEQTKQLNQSKRMAKSLEQKESRIRREIDQMKKQKVEYQRKMEENSKKYRQDAKERRLEIARLRKDKRLLANDKQKLQRRNDRDERLLKQKSEQVAAMQRKLRQAQRLTAHNRKLSEKEKKQRHQLEQWAKERIKREDELERLKRSLDKKKAAIVKKEKLCRELAECKRAAELRAKVAEQSAERIAVAAKQEKQNLQSLFAAGQAEGVPSDLDIIKKFTPEERQAYDELQERLENVEFEISFQDKKAQEAAANIPDDDEDDDNADDDSHGKSKSSTPGSSKIQQQQAKMALPFKVQNIDDARSHVSALFQMFVEIRKEKDDLEKTINSLKASKEAENKSRRDAARRKSLLPSNVPASPAGGFRSPHLQRSVTSPSMSPGAAGSTSPATNSANATLLHDKLSQSSELARSLYEENQKLRALLQENNIDPVEDINLKMTMLSIHQMEEQLRQLAVPQHGSSRRSSLSTSYAVPKHMLGSPNPTLTKKSLVSSLAAAFDSTPTIKSASSPSDSTKPTAAASSGISTPTRIATPSTTSRIEGNAATISASGTSSTNRAESSPSPKRRSAKVFDRLCDKKNFTGTARQKLIDQRPRRGYQSRQQKQQQQPNEVEIDSYSAEVNVDQLTFNADAYADIKRKEKALANQQEQDPTQFVSPGTSPRTSTNNSRGSPQSPKTMRRTSGGSTSPSFSKPTESYIRAQEGKVIRSNRRDSNGSTSSSSGKPFCSTAGGARTNTSKPYPAMTESSLLLNENGVYKSEGNGLYRHSAPQSAGRIARSRQLAWESQKPGSSKQRNAGSTSSNSSSPKLVEIDNTEASSRHHQGKSESSTPRSMEPGEKENSDEIVSSSVPIHEKLSDPRNYTGTQKHKVQDSSSSVPSKDARRAAMALERARRKKGNTASK